MDAKKLKLIVKGDKKSTFGTDPNEPWSVRAGITESERGELHAYLKSRGINPEFVSKDTKISHAKSSEFQKWRRDHQFDDPINFISTTAADRIKQQRAQTEEVTSEAWDNSATKIKKSLRAGTYNSKPTALDKFRAAAAERAKKHDDAEKEMKARHAAGKEDMKGAIDRLEKQLNKEEIEHKVGDSVTVNSKFFGKQKGKVTKVDSQSVHVVRDGKSSAEKYPHDAVVKEEIEQIDELNYDTVKSLYKKRRDDFHGAQIGKKKKGKEVSAKNVSRSISRLTGFKPTQNQPQKEEFELNEVSSSEVQHHFDNWTNSEHAPYNSDAGNDNKVHQSALRYLRSTNVPKEQHEKMAMHIAHKFHGSGIDEAAGISKTKETKFHKKLDKLVHSTFGKRKDEMKMKEEVVTEKNVPTSPEKWAQAKSQAKAKFDVYPSAYANGWASKKYKEMGGGWKSVSEAKDEQEYGYEGDMALNQLATLTRCADMIKELLKPDTDLPEWVQSKITLATDYIVTAADYLHSELKEETKKHPFVAVHAKKGTHETHGSTSYEAAQNAAKHWKMKNTAGIDVHRADKKHVAEEVEQLEEAPVVIKTNKQIGARVTSIGPGGKETVIKSDPPFEGPYTKVKKTITDKSGAKHTPMSRAKDLARMALSKQSKALKPVKEEKEDSRKAEIVKNVMKSAKKKKSESTETEKFEANPVLSSDIQKQ